MPTAAKGHSKVRQSPVMATAVTETHRGDVEMVGADRDNLYSTFYRTPVLPTPEELQIYKLWEMLLSAFDSHPLEGTFRCRTDKPILYRDDRNLHDFSLSPSISNQERMPARKTLRQAFWEDSVRDDHPDTIVKRFYYDAKGDLDKAMSNAMSTLRWRVETAEINYLMATGEEGYSKLATSPDTNPTDRKVAQGFMAQLERGLIYFRGQDKEGRPICWSTWVDHRRAAQPIKSMLDYCVWQIETARLVQNPGLSGVCIVFNMTDVLFVNIDLYLLRWFVEVMRAYYPLGIGSIIILSAPRWFESLFAMVRQMLNAETMEQITFVRSPREMQALIDRKWIPTALEGLDEFEYFYPAPAPGENERMKDASMRDELSRQRTAVFMEFEDVTRSMIAAVRNGAPHMEQLRFQRDCISDRYRLAYWRLDPYIRARTFYDRWNVTLPPISDYASSPSSDADMRDRFRAMSIDAGTQTEEWLEGSRRRDGALKFP